MSSLRGERQPRSVRHRISADARTDRDGHHRWRSGRALREPRARPGRRGARGARARPDRTELARALGQLLPGHSQLERAAPRPPVRRARPRRLHAPRRARALPRELREGGRRAGTRGRRGQLRRTGARRGLRSRHLGRRHRRLHRGPVHRRVPAAPPPGGRVHAPGRPGPDRRGGVPEPGGAAAGPGPGRRKRPVRLPDRRGASQGRPGRLPGVRASRVGPSPDRGARRRSGGSRRPATSTTGWTSCRAQPPGWGPTCRRPGRAAATTCITGRCSAWA